VSYQWMDVPGTLFGVPALGSWSAGTTSSPMTGDMIDKTFPDAIFVSTGTGSNLSECG
jgi:hypothetical protein